jgi:hypothetical protein
MAKVKEGVRLYVVNSAGDIQDSIPIGGYDLSKPMARSSLVGEIEEMLNDYKLLQESEANGD